MRYGPLLLAAMILTGCDQGAPGTPTAAVTPSAPATIATTNATIEPMPEAKASSAPASDAPAADCGADKAKSFVGRQDRPTTRADLAQLIGHDRIRWLGPDDAMTMDFSPKRLNVLLDAQKRTITGVKCG